MTDHLAEARSLARHAAGTYADACSLATMHALISIAERMGEPRPGVLLATEPEPDPVADALDEMAARQDTRLLPAPQAGGRAMTARTSPETRAELARLLDAATPGPWTWEGAGPIPPRATLVSPVEPVLWCAALVGYPTAPDGDLIAAAVNALPDILADLEDAEAEQERLTAALRLAQARAADAAVLPDLLAEAWDEGHHAGHEDARAVQATYPEPTPNPYRTEETR